MTYQNSKSINKKNTAGFTLIEMLVVIIIFCLLVVAIIGVFVSVLRIQRYYLASQQLLNETSYVMEYMGRFIRMAQKDSAGNCITQGTNYYPQLDNSSDSLKFLNYRSQCQEFYLGDEDEIPSATGTILYQKINDENILPLTSDGIEIKKLNFCIKGGDQGNQSQPRVTIYLEAEAVNSNPRPKIKIQTTISQRELDIY